MTVHLRGRAVRVAHFRLPVSDAHALRYQPDFLCEQIRFLAQVFPMKGG